MTEHTFKIGDVVQLASGGPRMMVEDERADGLIPCTWFAGADLRRDSFDHRVLVVAKDETVSDMPMKSVLMLDFGTVDIPKSVDDALAKYVTNTVGNAYAERQQARAQKAHLRGEDMQTFKAEEWDEFVKAWRIQPVKACAA